MSATSHAMALAIVMLRMGPCSHSMLGEEWWCPAHESLHGPMWGCRKFSNAVDEALDEMDDRG